MCFWAMPREGLEPGSFLLLCLCLYTRGSRHEKSARKLGSLTLCDDETIIALGNGETFLLLLYHGLGRIARGKLRALIQQHPALGNGVFVPFPLLLQ